MSTTRTWQDNAAEFALMDKQEGWLFARLIACSVKKGAGQGARQLRNDRSEVKVSAKQFAERAGTSHPRISRYLAAWDRAAEAGHCRPSSELTPGDADSTTCPPLETWSTFYDARKAAPQKPQRKMGTPTTSAPTTSTPQAARPSKPNTVMAHVPEPDSDEEIAEGIRQFNELQAQRKADEETRNRTRDEGFNHYSRAWLEMEWLKKWGHQEFLNQLVNLGWGLLDLDKAQDLTPEMFNDE